MFSGPEGEPTAFTISEMASSQKVRDEIENWFQNNKEFLDFVKPDQNKKPGTFQSPEGFSTVVGVGANPVVEKMTRQNELLEQIKVILEQQQIRDYYGVPEPFTDRVPLTMLKEGTI